jgi:hypothetical protein
MSINWLSIGKGFRTVAAGAFVAIGPSLLNYVTGTDWTATLGLSPSTGAILGAAIIALRAVTASPIFTKAS